MKKWHLMLLLLGCPILGFGISFFSSAFSGEYSLIVLILALLRNFLYYVGTYLIPIAYFFMVGFLLHKKIIKMLTALLCSLFYLIMVLSGFLLGQSVNDVIGQEGIMEFMALGMAWVIICGFSIVGAAFIVRLFLGKRSYTAAMNVWSVLVLGINVGIMYYFKSVEPFAKVLRSGDFEMLYYLIFEMAILAICSVAFCYLTTKRHFWIKMVVWYFEIAVAMFFVLMLWQGSDIITFFKYLGFISALGLAGPVWAFGLIGMALPKIQAENVLS